MATTPGSAAAISSATTCAASRPASGSGPPSASTQLLDGRLSANRPLVERAEELRGVVGGEAEDVLHGIHSAPRYAAGSPGLPALEEALDRRMQDDAVELVEREEPVAAHGLVGRGDPLERAARRSPAKMMWTTCFVVSARPGAIESTIAIGPSSGGASIPTSSAISRSSASISVSPEWTPPPGSSQTSRPRLSWRQSRMPLAPAQERRDADPGLGADHAPSRPTRRAEAAVRRARSRAARRPRAARTAAASTRTSCAIRMPGSTTNGSSRSVLSRITLHLAAVARSRSARAR